MFKFFTNICKAGHSDDQALNLIHDYQIRVMKAYKTRDPDIPPSIRDRLSRRHQTFVELLNRTMLPLVGGGKDIQLRHEIIADFASELNLKVSAYRGTFEEIKPQITELFDFERHVEENQAPGDSTGERILVTTMMGVRYKHPEKDWRICSSAKVKPWPVRNAPLATPKRVPLPDQPGSSIVPKKRRHVDLTRDLDTPHGIIGTAGAYGVNL